MRAVSRQRGAALIIGVFLIVVIALVGSMIALTSSTQQLTSGRNLQATGAYYAAQARLEREIDNVADTVPGSGSCADADTGVTQTIDGFTTELADCQAQEDIEEGGSTYDVFWLEVTAFDGSRSSGTLVRRQIEASVTNAN